MPSLSLFAWIVAPLAAAVMGFAIQRGATCMVAAVDQAVSERRFSRAIALAEAALWVAGLLALGTLAGIAVPTVSSFPGGWLAILGGATLGLGALVNEACVFGAVARLGSGDRHYLLTPAGYFLGSFLVARLHYGEPAALDYSAPRELSLLAAALFLPFALYRLAMLILATQRREFAMRLWLAHHATLIIGVTFVILMIAAGPWTYTQILSRLAHGGAGFGALDGLLLLTLLGGAVLGGWEARRSKPWSFKAAGKCLAGGTLMGIGSATIPGGNDNLILIGLPMLHAYAWLGIAAMILAIWAGLIVKARWSKLAPGLPANGASPTLPSG